MVAAGILICAVSPVYAQQGSRDLFKEHEAGIDGNMSFTTNYLFRGRTQSDDKPAIQGGLDYDLEIGPYVGTWWSSGSKSVPLEMDYYVGGVRPIGSHADVEARVTAYVYPHDTSQNSLEAKLAAFVGPVGAAYHYDFELYTHYAETGVRFEKNAWWVVGRGGALFRDKKSDTEDDSGWDWEIKVGYSFTESISVKAGAIGH
jgi:uncharacterized protein (TIGR02001 family)